MHPQMLGPAPTIPAGGGSAGAVGRPAVLASKAASSTRGRPDRLTGEALMRYPRLPRWARSPGVRAALITALAFTQQGAIGRGDVVR
jgi:hypothetical protein